MGFFFGFLRCFLFLFYFMDFMDFLNLRFFLGGGAVLDISPSIVL